MQPCAGGGEGRRAVPPKGPLVSPVTGKEEESPEITRLPHEGEQGSGPLWTPPWGLWAMSGDILGAWGKLMASGG